MRRSSRPSSWRRFANGLALLALALGCAQAQAPAPAPPEPQPVAAPRPFLYRIAAEPPSYLFGTIHLPDARVLAFPPSVERALEGSAVLFNEIALDAAGQQEVLALGVQQSEPPLRQRLDAELYQRLEAYLARRAIPIAAFDRQPLWIIASMLPLLDYFEALQTTPAQDQALAVRAREAGLELRGLESPQEQVDAFEAAGPDGLVEQLRLTLDQLEAAEERGERVLEELVLAYLAGDGPRVVDVSLRGVDPADPHMRELLENLMHSRSEVMAERIVDILRTEPGLGFFFAVGVGHLPGPRGVVQQLQNAGLTLERQSAD